MIGLVLRTPKILCKAFSKSIGMTFCGQIPTRLTPMPSALTTQDLHQIRQ